MSTRFDRIFDTFRDNVAAAEAAAPQQVDTAMAVGQAAITSLRQARAAARDTTGTPMETLFDEPGQLEFAQGFLQRMGSAAMPGAVSLSFGFHRKKGYRIGYVTPMPQRHLRHIARSRPVQPPEESGHSFVASEGRELLSAVSHAQDIEGWELLGKRNRTDPYPSTDAFGASAGWFQLPRLQGLYLCEDSRLRTNEGGGFIPGVATFTTGIRLVIEHTYINPPPLDHWDIADAPRGYTGSQPAIRAQTSTSTEAQYWLGLASLPSVLLAQAQVNLPSGQ